MSSNFSRIIAKPLEDPEHVAFRSELHLVHSEHACRYYLSILRSRDYYSEDYDSFREELTKFVGDHAFELQECWESSFYICDFCSPVLQDIFHSMTGIIVGSHRSDIDNRALIALLANPTWNDEQIARDIDTTVKQLRRCTLYKAARTEQLRSR